MQTKARRPRSVTWLALGVLSLAALNIWRAVQAGRDWARLDALPLSVSPAYLLLSGAVWGLVGFGLAWGLWWGLRWAPRVLQIASPAYALYFWVDRLALASNPLKATNQAFTAASSLVLLALIFFILWRPAAKHYFGDTHER